MTMRYWDKFLGCLFCSLLTTSSLASPPHSLAASEKEPAAAVEVVRASECYRYGDDETPGQAKRKAIILAQEQAVRSHRVFVQSSSKIKNFQMEEDLIQNVSAGMLNSVVVEKEEAKGQEVCVSISAKLSPVSVEELIQQRISAKDLVERMQKPLASSDQSGGLRVWTNFDEQKRDRKYLEGDYLTIHVQSERDGFLKLDYCGADGRVVHMVPNRYRGQAYIKGGQRYTFGGGALERFEVNSPFGDEAVKAIVSPSPISLDEEGADEESCREYLSRLYAKTRTIRVRAVETTLTLMTESKQVAEYKKERARQNLK